MTPELLALRAALGVALAEGAGAAGLTRVCAALMDALPGDAAAVTIMFSDQERQTIFAGDAVIQAFELAQFTLGEGPSLQAFSTGRPVLISDVTAPWVHERWPGLSDAIDGLAMASVFCLPMQMGAINIGVCTLYRASQAELTADEVRGVLDALDLTTLVLLQLRGRDRDENLIGRWLDVDGLKRRAVHQATGMLMVQLDVSAEEAFARLRGHSFADGRDIEQVAADIVNLRLVLTPDPHRDSPAVDGRERSE